LASPKVGSKNVLILKLFVYFYVNKKQYQQMVNPIYQKGRGAQINPANRFDHHSYDIHPLEISEENTATQYITVQPKTIITKVNSPDIPFEYSINPYQGCEHGCVYCYARESHNYWGYSAGIEFEQKILVKQDAPRLLEAQLKKKKYIAKPIMLSGNTDPYQPAEQKYGITRALLQVLWKYRHPVSIITKNSYILKDLDILSQLAEHNLVKVCLSITTQDEDLRRFLEPRTSSIKQRFQTVETLSAHKIPVMVMTAPIIPGLNEHEILPLARRSSEAGAYSLGYTMVRLNGDIGPIFEDWLRRTYPDRADKVLNKIKACHNGQLSDTRSRVRMRGEGKIAAMVKQQFALAKKLYFQDKSAPPFNMELFERFRTPQLSLF